MLLNTFCSHSKYVFFKTIIPNLVSLTQIIEAEHGETVCYDKLSFFRLDRKLCLKKLKMM